MNDIEKAKKYLNIPDVTCALCRNKQIFISEKTGISPMIEFIDNKVNLKDFCAADKIIGKAAALLFALAGVKEVYGEVMSKAALPILQKYAIHYEYGTLTENIVNRKGDDMCPMEKTVLGISNPLEAYEALKRKLNELRLAQ